MSLPRIPAVVPIIKSAIDEQSFEDIFIRDLKITTLDDSTQIMRIMFQYYDYDSNELNSDVRNIRTLRIGDLMAEMIRVPLLAQASASMVTAFGLLYQEAELVDMIEEESTPELVAQLATVRESLGI